MMSAALAASTLLCAGCESVIPRSDLQLMARTLPPSSNVNAEQRAAMAQRIRSETGVAEFEFSDSQFTPETRLPPGTEWILGVFLGE